MTHPRNRDDWQAWLDGLEPKTGVFVDGAFGPAVSGAEFVRVRPMDGRDAYAAARGNKDDIDRAVASAKCAFDDRRWRGKDPGDKKAVMLRWAELVRANAAELALLETLDVGKPISDALGWTFRPAPEHCSSMRKPSTRAMTRWRRRVHATAPSSSANRSESSEPSHPGTTR